MRRSSLATQRAIPHAETVVREPGAQAGPLPRGDGTRDIEVVLCLADRDKLVVAEPGVVLDLLDLPLWRRARIIPTEIQPDGR